MSEPMTMAATSPSAAAKAYDLMRSGHLSEAVAFAEQAVSGARVLGSGHGFLASLYLKLGRPAEAAQVISTALQLGAGDADAYDGVAYVCMALGRHDQANSLYRQATQQAPQVPRFWYNLAGSERSLGRLADAEAACDKAITIDRSQYPTYLLRSELRLQTEQSNHIAELQTLLARSAAEHRARVFLGYALAKELDDVGRFDEAFRWFSTAAAARRSRLTYDVAADERKLQRIAESFAHAVSRDDSAVKSSRYIFIVGLPRSGTTLLERILTGLPQVRSNGETENFSRALLAASRGEGDVFQRAAAADPETVAENYAKLAPTGEHGDYVIEKLPMNYLYLGAIHLALPEAKILLLRRSPLDSCFAMYRTLFGDAYPFSYDLEELARYYVAYEALIDHWRKVIGAGMHEVIYEDLVKHPRRVGEIISRYCELGWNPAAIDIQSNQAVSLTASAAQVRRPIYGSSSGRWRHYRRHLQGLVESLRSRGVALPEEEP